MLVFKRKLHEKIDIGDAEVTVIAAGDGWVKLGIKAPKDVLVNRREVTERIAAKQEKAVLPAARAVA